VITRHCQPADRRMSAQGPEREEEVPEPVASEAVRRSGELIPTAGALCILLDTTQAQPQPPTSARLPITAAPPTPTGHDSRDNSDLSGVFFTRRTDSCHPFGWRPRAGFLSSRIGGVG
jgi:hypothetical protein